MSFFFFEFRFVIFQSSILVHKGFDNNNKKKKPSFPFNFSHTAFNCIITIFSTLKFQASANKKNYKNAKKKKGEGNNILILVHS